MANFFDQFDSEASSGPTISSRDRDLAIRTIYGEAADEPDEGKAAVAAVIRNRTQAGRYGGKDVSGVVMAPNQFEPWSRSDARNRMMSLKPDSPDYQRIGQIVDGVFTGQTPDPTNGATHFFAPEAQAALGRRPPAWAKGDAQAIGRHTFYAPEGRVGSEAKRPTDVSAQAKPKANFFDQFDAAPEPTKPQEGPAFDERFPSEGEFAPRQPALTDAITDIPKEVGKAAGEALTNIKGIANRGGQGPIEGLVTTGKAALGVPQLIMSPITGAARSVLGHGLESATNAAGELIAPELAAKRDRQKDYETAKGDVDTAMTAVAPGKVRAPKVSAPTIQELKTAAKADYDSPEVKGLVVKPDTIKNYGATARADLNNQGFDENVAPKTFGILSKLDTIPAGSTVTGDNFNSLRKMLGKAAGSIEPAEKAAASMAIEHLDNFIPAIPAGEVIAGDVGAAAGKLETARGNYSAAKQSEKIDQKLVAAETRAAAANSGMNVANTIRQRMADVVLNPKQARGLRPEEIEAAKAISEGTRTQNVVRGASNILGGGGGLGTVAAATAGGLATGGPGALAPVAGFALKALSNRLTIRQAEKLSEMIRSRAPLASSAAKYNQAAANLQANRTPQAIAGALLAARNFATNLKSAGFNVSPAELLSGMQTTRAEEQQEQIPRPDAE